MSSSSDFKRQAFVVTGPTSGLGYAIALELAGELPGATLVLLGRDQRKLDDLARQVETRGCAALVVRCDLSEPRSAIRAAGEIVTLLQRGGLALTGLVNCAGLQQQRPTTNADGVDLTFAVNHLSAFALTEALLPSFAVGSSVLFIASDTEDPDRWQARIFGFRGARYLSAAASAKAEFAPGGSKVPGQDAYATSKLANILTAKQLAREVDPARVRFASMTPGLLPGTGLAREAHGAALFAWNHVLPLFTCLLPGASTPTRAARVAARILKDSSASSGTYYDDRGRAAPGSSATRDPDLAARLVAETRALLHA
ncbi:MAG: short-chain dehydrogenase/reductase [bacterium]|nr:short-chain dehydrogenase/reductase [bacterium]